MLSRIRGIIVLIQFSITVAIVIALMYIFRSKTHIIIKAWMRIQIFLLGIKLEVEGQADNSCDMVLMNHQSLLDIIVMEHVHTRDLAWIAKREITDLFFFGHIIKAPKMITIDRENKAGIIHLLKESKDRLSKGRPIAIFPEGTRSDGENMLKFRPGAKMIANKMNLKIQPAIIINTRNILDSKSLKQKPGVVKIKFLEPVQAQKGTSWFEDLETTMNETFQKEISSNVS